MRRAATRIACLVILVLASLTLVAPPTQAADSPSLFGTVTDAATGTPVSGACVIARQPGFLWELARSCTGADGGYRIDGLSAIGYRVEVVADGFAPQWAPDEPNHRNAQNVVVSGTAPTQLNLGLHDDFGTVRGMVTDPEGRPAALGTVYLKSTSTPWDANTVIGVDGLFSLSGVPAGGYTVQLLHPELATQWFDGKTTATDANVVTVPAGGELVVNEQFLVRNATAGAVGTLTGTITDRITGAPIAGARVTLLTPTLERAGEAVSNAAGEVSIAGVPVNAFFRAQIAASGYALYWFGDSTQLNGSATLRVASGSNLNSRLRRGSGTLRGQVTDPTGGPVRANMLLRLPGRSGDVTYQTRLDGSFEFTNVPADTFSAGFASPNLGTQNESFTISDGQTTTHNVRHAPRGRLEVALLDSETLTPVANVCATIGLQAWHGGNPGCSGPSGVVTIADLAPGTADVTVNANGNLSVLGTVQRNVIIRSGETTRLTLVLRSAGIIATTVQRASDGTIPLVCVRPVPVAMGAPTITGFGEPGPSSCNRDATGNTTDVGRDRTNPDRHLSDLCDHRHQPIRRAVARLGWWHGRSAGGGTARCATGATHLRPGDQARSAGFDLRPHHRPSDRCS